MLSVRSPASKQKPVKNPEFVPIGDLAFLWIEGQDAEDFAQAQFMNDVHALPPGDWQWSGQLNAQGRVLALFALARPAPGRLLLALLDTDPQAFAENLKRYVFRRKLSIGIETGLHAHARFDNDAPAPQHGSSGTDRQRLRIAANGAIGFDCSGEGGDRELWALPADSPPPTDPMASRRWREADLRHGLPRWPRGSAPRWTPHMLSLERLRAFSVKKGCYPGQEIVARTHYLGQSKRRAWWLQGQGLAAEQPVQDGSGQELGILLEASADGSGALAILALAAPAPLRAGTGPAQALPLLDGLAR